MYVCNLCGGDIGHRTDEKSVKLYGGTAHESCYKRYVVAPKIKKDGLRTLYRDAFLAAIGAMPMVQANCDASLPEMVSEAHMWAIEAVRQWTQCQAELDAEIAKIVEVRNAQKIQL